MEAGYYKMMGGEMLHGTKISSPAYTLTEETKEPVDGWVWYTKPPVAEVVLPCGCHVKILIDPAKMETTESTQASIDVISAKVIEGKAQTVSVSVTIEAESITEKEAEAIIG